MKRLFHKELRPDSRDCEDVRELMSEYVDGELDPAKHRHVEDHVGICRPCRQVLENLRHTLARLRRLGGRPEAEDTDAVAERARRNWRERA